MNVFWLDEDPRLAARYHGDRHVNKMLLEAAQLLCTAARRHGCEDDSLYRATHRDHPMTKWVCESRANWLTLREHAWALNEEFRARFDKQDDHASWTVIQSIDPDEIDFPSGDPTPKPQVMPETYQIDGDPVAAYRSYYAGEKASWAEWKHTGRPPWLDSVEAGQQETRLPER